MIGNRILCKSWKVFKFIKILLQCSRYRKKTWSIDFFIFSYKYNTVKDYKFWKTTKLMIECINQKQWIHFITYLGRYKKRRKHFSVLNVRLVCHKALIQEINVITFWSTKNCMNVWLLLLSWSVNSLCST